MTFAGSSASVACRAGAREFDVALFVFQVLLLTTLWRLADVAVLRLSSASSRSQALTVAPRAPAQGDAASSAAPLRMCVDRHKWRVLRSRSLPMLPFSGSARFSPPRCYQASQASLLQYYTRICHPLLPPRFGSRLIRFGFLCRLATVRSQSRRASLGKALDLPTYRPPPHRLASPDTGPRLFASARPAYRSHIGGSLFATYAGSTSCFLPTRRFCSRSCLVGLALPSGNGGQFYFRRHAPEGRSMCHARHTPHVGVPAPRKARASASAPGAITRSGRRCPVR